MMTEKQSANGHESDLLNRDVTEQPTLITTEQIKTMDYLFKEARLNNGEDFKELGLEFDE